MSHAKHLAGMAVAAALLSACGGTNSETSAVATSTDRGTLIQDPPFRVASLDAPTLGAELSASASGQQLQQLSGAPACGVDVYDYQYYTVGAQGETASASAALMVPTGAAAQCNGPRPIVLYGHGTQPDRTANLADITNAANSEGVMVAAMFAAQGFIVVAPNYAGYDTSSLPYHPFLNADQQSKDMIDALKAARTALPHTMAAATSDGGKLFITGYSAGGFVAMATQRAMQNAGQSVTAAAPMSGPYALEAFGDAVLTGHVNLGSTVFVPMIITSYQHAYGNIYTDPLNPALTGPAAIYDPAYAATADNVLPSNTPLATLFQQGTLPQTALFNSNTPVTGNAALDAALAVPSNASDPNTPLYQLGFGSPGLVNNDLRITYVGDAAQNPDGANLPPSAGLGISANPPANTLRAALKTNDLRNPAWVPGVPTLMCGGNQDPTVFYSVNTSVMQGFWGSMGLPADLITVVDVNTAPSATDPFAPVETAFQQTMAGIAAAAVNAGATDGGQSAAVQAYHSTVAPFCAVVARAFFGKF